VARGAKYAAVKELDSLTRAADAYTRAIELYGKASGYRNSAQRLRDAQRQKQLIDTDIQILSLSEPLPRDPGLVRRTRRHCPDLQRPVSRARGQRDRTRSRGQPERGAGRGGARACP